MTAETSFHAIDEEPEPFVYRTWTEQEHRKVLRTGTEPNPHCQRTRNKLTPRILGYFPSQIIING